MWDSVALQGHSSERMFLSKSGQNEMVPQEKNKLGNSRYTSRLKMLSRVTFPRFSSVNYKEG